MHDTDTGQYLRSYLVAKNSYLKASISLTRNHEITH